MSKYIVGALLVAASMAVTGYLMQRPPEERPMPHTGGGILDLHADDLLDAAKNTPATKP
jgi:hypothetical protein